MTITIKNIWDRLPIELIPININESSMLSAITQLKIERNNALFAIEEHNDICHKMCNRDRCGYARYDRNCPECPKYFLIEG